MPISKVGKAGFPVSELFSSLSPSTRCNCCYSIANRVEIKKMQHFVTSRNVCPANQKIHWTQPAQNQRLRTATHSTRVRLLRRHPGGERLLLQREGGFHGGRRREGGGSSSRHSSRCRWLLLLPPLASSLPFFSIRRCTTGFRFLSS